ncbi:MAG: hypothetical protein M3440_08175 [Chloroflexota bacterium]|nr:hypothetical protein [Chloroflexota bacterium]
MPKLSNIQKDDETKKVDIEEWDLTVVCYPNRITGKRRRELQDLDEDDTERYAELFFDVIKEWDLTDDNDVVLPFTAETIDALSMRTTIRLFTEIGESVNPDPKTRKRSRGR